MDVQRAIKLLEGAVPRGRGIWADFGSGDGTFTLALADLLGSTSRIYAVDNDAKALSRLDRRAAGRANLVLVVADFAQPFDLPGYGGPLDGILLANSLHFVEDQEGVLARLARSVRPDGCAVFVEYDRRAASRWVPYPIPPARLGTLAASAGLSKPAITATIPSEYSGSLYVAVATRPAA